MNKIILVVATFALIGTQGFAADEVICGKITEITASTGEHSFYKVVLDSGKKPILLSPDYKGGFSIDTLTTFLLSGLNICFRPSGDIHNPSVYVFSSLSK
jgi:hypothetical protein